MNLYWKFAGIAIYTLAVFSCGWQVKDWKDISEATARVLAEKDATITATTAVVNKERDYTNKTNEVSDAYQSKITLIGTQYHTALDSLQPDPGSPSSNSVRPESEAKCGSDATTSRDKLSRKNKQVLLELMKQADLQTAQLLACQQWIKTHE